VADKQMAENEVTRSGNRFLSRAKNLGNTSITSCYPLPISDCQMLLLFARQQAKQLMTADRRELDFVRWA